MTNAPRGGEGGGTGTAFLTPFLFLYFLGFSRRRPPRCDLLCRLTGVEENCNGSFIFFGGEEIRPTPVFLCEAKAKESEESGRRQEGNSAPGWFPCRAETTEAQNTCDTFKVSPSCSLQVFVLNGEKHRSCKSHPERLYFEEGSTKHLQ